MNHSQHSLHAATLVADAFVQQLDPALLASDATVAPRSARRRCVLPLDDHRRRGWRLHIVIPGTFSTKIAKQPNVKGRIFTTQFIVRYMLNNPRNLSSLLVP